MYSCEQMLEPRRKGWGEARGSGIGCMGIRAKPSLKVQGQSYAETTEQWIMAAEDSDGSEDRHPSNGSTAPMNVQAEATQSHLHN